MILDVGRRTADTEWETGSDVIGDPSYRGVQDVVTSLPGDEHKGLKRIVIMYLDGVVRQHEGTLLDASEMARSWGLTVTPTTDCTVHWQRDTSTFKSS